MIIQSTIKKGYKKTEVGVIPNDWDVNNLGNLGTTNIGLTYSPRDVVEYGLLVHRSSNIQSNKLAYNDNVYVNLEVNEKLILKENDILICVRNGSRDLIGKSAIIKGKSIGETFGAFMSVYRTEINPQFVYYLMLSNVIQKQINVSLGATINQLTNKTINDFEIPLPPTKTEQTLIATALSDADALISSLEKLIEKKRAIKHGAMQQLLKPKKSWINKSLHEIGVITGAGVDKKINDDEIPVRLLNYMDVFKRDFIYSNEINHWVTAKAYKIQKCSVQKADIFFTPSSEMRFDIAISAIAVEDIPDVVYSYHLVRLRLFEDWDLNFTNYIFKTKYFLSQAEQICEGSGKRYVISLPKFRNMNIYFPPTKVEQIQISRILYDMDSEIIALEEKLKKQKMIKQGMMQSLLTGKIRLI